jgi:hypothetical protein
MYFNAFSFHCYESNKHFFLGGGGSNPLTLPLNTALSAAHKLKGKKVKNSMNVLSTWLLDITYTLNEGEIWLSSAFYFSQCFVLDYHSLKLNSTDCSLLSKRGSKLDWMCQFFEICSWLEFNSLFSCEHVFPS